MIFKSYGLTSKDFDVNHKYFPRHNIRVNKPNYCLWASPKGNQFYRWEDFVREQYKSELPTLKKSISFVLKHNTRILCIRNHNELIQVYKKYSIAYMAGKNLRYRLDWNRIRKDYDAIFIYISKLSHDDVFKFTLNGWDVDSLVVFNLKTMKLL